jgi:transmembrane sensor
VGPTYVRATLEKGAARFDVIHRDERVFRVEAGPVAVQVLGTTFAVERIDGQRSRVSVEQGRVRVFWSGGSRDLAAGEAGAFPPDNASPAIVALPSAAAGVAEASSVSPPTAHPQPVERQAEPSAWRQLAVGGAFDDAYVALKREGMQGVHEEVNDLLLAADVARLSHHPSEAVEPLSRILQRHPTDPRASLAAFTLGRVRLESLGQPREAASAFAQARSLDPHGELSGDALAREVEARAAAGETEAARGLAEQYVREYPAGSRIRSVRRYGGLE